MKRISIVLLATLLASVFAFTSCGKDDNNTGDGGTSNPTTYQGSYSMTFDGITSTKMYNNVILNYDEEESNYTAGAYGINPENHKFVFAVSNVPEVGVQTDVDYTISTAPSVAVMYPNGEKSTFVSYSGFVKRDTEDKVTVSVTGRVGSSTEDVALTGTLNIGVRN